VAGCGFEDSPEEGGLGQIIEIEEQVNKGKQ